jgi:hypothetical protein
MGYILLGAVFWTLWGAVTVIVLPLHVGLRLCGRKGVFGKYGKDDAIFLNKSIFDKAQD